MHLRCESGHIFGVEFVDVTGHTIHRFTAAPASNLDVFLSWVRLHQSCSEHRSVWLQVKEEDNSVDSHVIDPISGAGTILSILVACCERRLGVRATVHTSGVVQRAHFIPQSRQAIGDWWFSPTTIWSACTFVPRSSPMPKSRHRSTSAARAFCFAAIRTLINRR